MIPRLRMCSGFNVVYVSLLVGRRRLDPNESQPLPYKDGRPHFITTKLRIICAPSTQLNGHNTRPLNSTMSTINSLPTFSLLSRIPSKRISPLHHWAPNAILFLILIGTSSIPLLATCCSTLQMNPITMMTLMWKIMFLAMKLSFNAVMRLRLEATANVKSRALALFK